MCSSIPRAIKMNLTTKSTKHAKECQASCSSWLFPRELFMAPAATSRNDECKLRIAQIFTESAIGVNL